MAAQSPPYAIQASSHSAELFRRALGSMINGSGIVAPGTDLKVSQNTGTDLKVQVSAGQAWIAGTLGSANGLPINRMPLVSLPGTVGVASPNFTSQGMYYGYNDAAIVGLTLAAANATYSRHDLIVATVTDAQYAGATNSFVIQVITGTPATTPVNPTTPANSIALGFVNVSAAATAVGNGDIGDLRVGCSIGLRSNDHVSGYVPTSESTTSNAYTDLATVGPSGSLFVPNSGKVRLVLSASLLPSTSDYCQMGWVASGTNTLGTSNKALIIGNAGNINPLVGVEFVITGLTSGLTTFTAKYRSGFGASANFSERRLDLEALP